jgi:Zn-finger nucleic acid-binding protein
MTTVYKCPACHTPLSQRRYAPGSCWSCESCSGAAVTVTVLRQHAAKALANQIWSEARSSRTDSTRACPGCGRPFKFFRIEDVNGHVELDGCVSCQFLWFDSTELARLNVVMRDHPPGAARRAPVDLPPAAAPEVCREVTLAGTIFELLYWICLDQ